MKRNASASFICQMNSQEKQSHSLNQCSTSTQSKLYWFFFVKICITSSLPFCHWRDCLREGCVLRFTIIIHVVDLNFIHSIACWDKLSIRWIEAHSPKAYRRSISSHSTNLPYDRRIRKKNPDDFLFLATKTTTATKKSFFCLWCERIVFLPLKCGPSHSNMY